MPLKYNVGETFPDMALCDDRNREVTISDVAQGQPLFLAFFRGPW